MKRILHSIPLVFIATAIASADVDGETRSLLITKLEKVQMQLAPNDSSKVAVTLRLADLYAERARINSMEELNKGCQTCNAGDADRKKALRFYLEVMDRAPEASRGKVMVQIGHLYQITGSEEKAVEFYQKVLQAEKHPGLRAEADLSLGEIYFKRRDFAKALGSYSEVIKNPAASSKGLAAYRSAWCAFNQGQVVSAIEQVQHILKTPALLSRNGASGNQVDSQFHEEVALDFVTFLAKEQLTPALVQSLYDLSPERIKSQNVQSLALEQERLGKKAEALSAWKFVYGHLNKAEDRLAAQISMAQLEFDGGNRKEALMNYEKALQVWKEFKSCGSDQCEELRKRARQFVVSWNQIEKKQVSEDLLTAYQMYSGTFPEDVDMFIYQAQVAEDLKNYPVAWEAMSKALPLLVSKNEGAKLETLLLKQIELAETAKNEDQQNQAADLYLKHSSQKTKTFEVQYQKARNLYEKANYTMAVDELRALALLASGDLKIRKQAADLSLDGLVLLKDETRLPVWAKEYSSIFKDSASEYSQIVQKSILTKSTQMADLNTAGAYQELLAFNVAQAQPEDRLKYYKNKLIMAEKLQKFPEAVSAADDLLVQPGLSFEDREFAWSRKAYLSEMLLDFGTALAATEKIEKSISSEDKALKLAIFAELSGSQSESYYQRYLQASKDEEHKRLVAAELIRKSKKPDQTLEMHRALLEKSPALFAQLSAEVYARTNNEAILKRVQKDSTLAATDAGKLMIRVAFLKTYADLKKKISNLKLETANDRKLATSIKARAGMLEQIETMTKHSIQSSDWTSQLVSLDLLAKESDRFYQELLSAPVPAGLSGDDEQQYLSLLSAQAAPYQTKAAAAKVKVEEFWKNPNWETSLNQAWTQTALRPLLSVEITALKDAAPEQTRTLANVDAKTATTDASVRPSSQVVQDARRQVYQKPFDKQALENLLSVEIKSENSAMVQYLQTRLANLDKEIK
ncbi:MAG: tetratricopeptide repeat protein [Pseudobdellovibrionaceae bacterium]